jgi:16S rRNA (cytosine967-C5)-methyltransferase
MRLDLAMNRTGAGLESRERGFAQELAYGAIRLQGRLDHLLAEHVRSGLEGLHVRVLHVLRLGLYQLLYLDVPDYAAVSQAVEQVRHVGQGRAAGLVNAVLRAAARGGDGPERFPDPTVDPAEYLVTWGSHPRWLVDRWLERWPFDEVRRLVELNNRVPRLHLVPVDPGGLDEAAERLRREPGVEAEVLAVPGVLRVSGIDPRSLLETVPGFVQDPAAALVCRYAAVPPDTLVADLCAAPGGKALSLSRRARYVLAADPSVSRLRLLRENVDRLGLPVGVVRARAEDPPLRGTGPAAPRLTLLDVPCSGTGTLGRHPDARWRLSPTAPEEMARVQARILRKAAGVVPPGGVLVYSTCTLEPEENQGVVEAFLGDRPDFRWSPPEDPELELNDGGWMEVLPQRTGFDGAFAARLVRTG